MDEEFNPGTLASLAPHEVFRRVALCGKDTWNNWRAGKLSEQESEQLAVALALDALPPHDKPISFSGVDFTKVKMPNFSGMDFGNNADFRRTKFKAGTDFGDAIFGEWANFDDATFGSEANFDDATFGVGARFIEANFENFAQFKGTIFGNLVQFDGATFGDQARFNGAIFGDEARFCGAIFGDRVQFDGAIFGDAALFDGAILRHWAQFNGATFGDFAQFDGASFGDFAQFDSAKFSGAVYFRALTQESLRIIFEEIAERSGIKDPDKWVTTRLTYTMPEDFHDISFAKCRFIGLADFSDRIFKAQANFRNASFVTPPIFTNVSGAENIDPTSMIVRHITFLDIWFLPRHVKFEWTDDSAVTSRVRQLRKLMEESKAHDVERRLFIIERRLERGSLWKRDKLTAAINTFLLFLFSRFSDYGRSVMRPIGWLAAGFFVFHTLTRWAFNTLPDVKPRGFWDDRLLELSLGNALPIFGTLGGNRQALLTKLFPTGVPTSVELLSVGHSLVSVILIFLILLAIRNFFKIG